MMSQRKMVHLHFLIRFSQSKLLEKQDMVNKNQSYRLKDEIVEKSVPQQKWIRLKGKPNTALFIDTSRCFHLGSRVLSGERKY